MRAFFSSPLNLITVLLIGIIYFYLLYRYSSNPKVLSIFEKVIIIGFVAILSGITLPGLFMLRPGTLLAIGKPLGSIIFQLLIYIAALVFIRIQLTDILSALTDLTKPIFWRIFFIFLLFSSLWSGTQVKTFLAFSILFLISIFAAYCAREYDWSGLLNILLWSNTSIAILSAFSVLLIPSLGLHGKGWKGVLGHPIHLGNLMALTSVLWLLYAIYHSQRRWLSISLSASAFMIMQMANSAGGFVTFVALISTLGLLQITKKLKARTVVIVFIVYLILGIFSANFVIEMYDEILISLGRNSSLTGRGPLWQLVWQAIKIKPVLGYGYDAFWQTWRGLENPAQIVIRGLPPNFPAVHAHNGFLDIWLNIGLIGLITFSICFFQAFLGAIHELALQKNIKSELPILLLIYIVFYNISDTSLLGPNYIWFCYVLVATKIQLNKKYTKPYFRQ